MTKFVVVSGPSCVGKGPLYRAMRRFHPELVGNFQQLVLFNDRPPRPGEQEGVDYFFRPRTDIEALDAKGGYLLVNVRDDLQALEVNQIRNIMDAGKTPFFEGNPFMVARLRELGLFEQIPTVSVFLSPLCREEILYLKAPERRVEPGGFVTEVQRRKLLHRARRQKSNLSLNDLEDIEKRAASAAVEMREAWKFDHVIHLHDGEGNDNWDAFHYPIGNARKAMAAFAALLRGETHPNIENWEKDLVP